MHFLFQLLFLGLLGFGALIFLEERARAGGLARLRDWLDVDGTVVLPVGRKPASRSRQMDKIVARIAQRTGVTPTMRAVMFTLAGLVLCATAFAFLWGATAALLSVVALLLIASAVVNVMAGFRLTRLGSLMPSFFDRVRQLLTIGNSLPTAFDRAVQGSQPLLAETFAPTVRRIHHGAGFAESIAQAAEDTDLYEMHLFAAAVAANTRFGGSLTHALNNLILYLRKRMAIERELRASTAEIRASAWVLGLLPTLVGGAIVLQNRDYASWFVINPTGKILLIYCGLSQLIGACLMRMIVKTKF